MKEKIKTICLILITIAVLIIVWRYWVLTNKQIQGEMLYLNAYKNCLETFDYPEKFESWKCINILNGASSQ